MLRQNAVAMPIHRGRSARLMCMPPLLPAALVAYPLTRKQLLLAFWLLWHDGGVL